jgi:hypothetical protein
LLCAVVVCAVGAGAAEAAGAPTISEQWVTSVSAEGATFHAQINPNESDTTYRFEYGTSASYGTAVPIPDGDIGSGAAAISVSAHVAGLASSTAYHFRVVATSAEGTVYGADELFTTQPAHTSSVLPDGREYEQVSPVNKHGANIYLEFVEGGRPQAAEDGTAITYVTSAPMVEATGNDLNAQVLSTRSSNGWSSRQIDSPHVVAGGLPPAGGVEFRAFSEDLSRGELDPARPAGQPTLSPEAAAGLEGGYLYEIGSSVYAPFVTAAEFPGTAKVAVNFADASPDLKHILFTSEAALTPNATPGSRFSPNFYEWTDGKIYLVNALTGGTSVSNARLGGIPEPNFALYRTGFNIVSTEGNRVFWNAEGNSYVTDPFTQTTVQMDEALGGGSRFITATPNGRYALLEHVGGMYRYDTYTDSLEALPAGGGVVGLSDDGNTIYVGGLSILQHDAGGWKVTVIAGLSAKDEPDWSEEPVMHVSRVSASGRYVAFMSDQSLTGYDNRDANSGQPDEEVYLYDSVAKRLTCVSCNPTGARPEGVLDEFGSENGVAEFPMDEGNWVFSKSWLAAAVPGYGQVEKFFGGIRQARYLSEDGRVFFNSRDPISPLQTGGHEEVYEYEPDGVGSCKLSAGCVFLISSGVGATNSTFLDASANGEDVFFRTRDKLASSDVDTSLDVYDAHACSASAPCFPQEALPPACTTAEACRAAPTPQPTLFGAPSSETFDGHGNLTAQPQAPTKRVVTKRSSTSKLNAALRACKRRDAHNDAKRRRCERRAQLRYGHGSKVSQRIKSAGVDAIKGRR